MHMMPSYRANLHWEERWYTSPRCSCTVTYAFHDSSQTVLITCHHKFKSHISAHICIWSVYPNHLLHHVNSDRFCLHNTHCSKLRAEFPHSMDFGRCVCLKATMCHKQHVNY